MRGATTWRAACCGVLEPKLDEESAHGGREPGVGLEKEKGVLTGKKTCGLSAGVSEVGAYKRGQLDVGCQHEEGIHKVGGSAWLVRASVCMCVCVCPTWRIRTLSE